MFFFHWRTPCGGGGGGGVLSKSCNTLFILHFFFLFVSKVRVTFCDDRASNARRLCWQIFPMCHSATPQTILLGWEPWSCGYGRRLMFQRSWIRIPGPYTTGWIFFLHLFVVKIVKYVWKTKINKKEAGVGPFSRNLFVAYPLVEISIRWSPGSFGDKLKSENTRTN